MNNNNNNKDNISIIIPTYNRCNILLKVLNALERQTLEKKWFEVVVVDDGSNDGTEQTVKNFIKKSSLKIFYYYQVNKKQGAARNLGIAKAKMPLVLFIGDDIIPKNDFVESHLKFYKMLDKPENSAVIGYTTWHGDIKVTPFMRYIGEYGHQFGFSLINGNGPLRFNFYYTSNLLIPASVLKKLEYCFDEDFNVYGWEDIELGFRLENLGVKLYYNPEAVAFHYHRVSISSFCRRQRNVGKASNIFIEKHPELTWFLGDRNLLEKKLKFYHFVVIFEKILNFFDSVFQVSASDDWYRFILDTNYAIGAVKERLYPSF